MARIPQRYKDPRYYNYRLKPVKKGLKKSYEGAKKVYEYFDKVGMEIERRNRPARRYRPRRQPERVIVITQQQPRRKKRARRPQSIFNI